MYRRLTEQHFGAICVLIGMHIRPPSAPNFVVHLEDTPSPPNRSWESISEDVAGLSLYRVDEFSILRVFVSLKFPFTTKIVEEFQRRVSIYVRYISQKHENFRYWPNKSHDVTIETPTNHSSSRRDIVFRSVESNVGITR
jgi:hypothetical protein